MDRHSGGGCGAGERLGPRVEEQAAHRALFDRGGEVGEGQHAGPSPRDAGRAVATHGSSGSMGDLDDLLGRDRLAPKGRRQTQRLVDPARAGVDPARLQQPRRGRQRSSRDAARRVRRSPPGRRRWRAEARQDGQLQRQRPADPAAEVLGTRAGRPARPTPRVRGAASADARSAALLSTAAISAGRSSGAASRAAIVPASSTATRSATRERSVESFGAAPASWSSRSDTAQGGSVELIDVEARLFVGRLRQVLSPQRPGLADRVRRAPATTASS